MTAGASVMVLELVAPRMYAPLFGTSTYVWTMVIGVVMASLALGYVWGGRLADRDPRLTTLGKVLSLAAALAFGVLYLSDAVLFEVLLGRMELLAKVAVVSVVVLAPVSVVLGMVGPIVARLQIESKKTAGKRVGRVYALSTVGSIVGTFGAGFYLIPNFAIDEILWGVAVCLTACAVVTVESKQARAVLFAALAALSWQYWKGGVGEGFERLFERAYRAELVADFSTQYSRVWISERDYQGGRIRVLANEQSFVFVDRPIEESVEGPQNYLKFYNLAHYLLPRVSEELMIGGGAYTYAAYTAKVYPETKLLVVEIDQELSGVAREYFGYRPTGQISDYFGDGRVFLNKNEHKFDAILLDAYRSGSAIPFQLVTREAYRLMYAALNSPGVVIVNVIASVEGSGRGQFESQYLTMREVFDWVRVFLVGGPESKLRQNIMLVGGRGESGGGAGEGYPQLLASEYRAEIRPREGAVMRDDWAPVEYLDLLNKR